MGRAPASGESWLPPLGPVRPDGLLEPPVFAEEPDDTEDAAAPEDDEPARGADPLAGANDNDDALATALAAVERDDNGDQAEMYAISRATE